MRALQWDIHTVPSSDIVRLVAVDGILRGYGYGPGTSMMFGTPMGDITVENEQWVVRHDDGRIEVLNEKPDEAEIFDARSYLKEIQS